MIKVIKYTIYVFLVITALTAALVIAGLVRLWFFPSPQNDLPHLKCLLGVLIVEIVAVVLAYARKGIRYLPHVEEHKQESDTLRFMTDFISNGSTIQIVSNRLAWLRKSPKLVDVLKEILSQGGLVEFFTPQQVSEDVLSLFPEGSARFFVTHDDSPPEARFTLVNGNRSGAERLAIARGSHPEHEVTVFDTHSGPQIIGMAKDIIRKSREMADASPME